MSLRATVVGAATDEFRACMADDELLGQIPVRLLDAILDTLSEKRDEIWPKRHYANWNNETPLKDLIAALRETEAGQ